MEVGHPAPCKVSPSGLYPVLSTQQGGYVRDTNLYFYYYYYTPSPSKYNTTSHWSLMDLGWLGLSDWWYEFLVSTFCAIKNKTYQQTVGPRWQWKHWSRCRKMHWLFSEVWSWRSSATCKKIKQTQKLLNAGCVSQHVFSANFVDKKNNRIFQCTNLSIDSYQSKPITMARTCLAFSQGPRSNPEHKAWKQTKHTRAFSSPFCDLMFFFIFLYQFSREMLIYNALGN